LENKMAAIQKEVNGRMEWSIFAQAKRLTRLI